MNKSLQKFFEIYRFGPSGNLLPDLINLNILNPGSQASTDTVNFIFYLSDCGSIIRPALVGRAYSECC